MKDNDSQVEIKSTVEAVPAFAGSPPPDAPPAADSSGKKKFLTAAFNMAVGAGVGFAVKSCVAAAVCTVGMPVLAATAIAAATAGVVTGLVKIGIDNKGNFYEAFGQKNRSANLKKLAFHTGFTMLGGLLFGAASEYGGGVLSKVFNFFSGNTDVVAPVTVVAAPVVIPEVTPEPTIIDTSAAVAVEPPTGLAKVADIIAHDDDISDRAKTAFARAQRGNAQALKDLGFFLFNGREGFPVDRPLGVDMFGAANALGHGGAGVDLAYTEYHGLGNVAKSHGGGISKMVESLDHMADDGQAGTPENNRGWDLLRAWLGPFPADTQTPIVMSAPIVETPVAAVITPPVEAVSAPAVDTTAAVFEKIPLITSTAQDITTPAAPVTEVIPVSTEVIPVSTDTPSCTSVISGTDISFHCKAGQHMAIINGDKIRLSMTAGR